MQKYPQYSSKQKWIHWTSALLVIMVTMLLLIKVTMSHILGGMAIVYLLHKSFGVLVLILTIWRIMVIRSQGVPDVLPKDKKLQRILSKSTQGVIYLLLLITPLSGYLMSGRDLNIFGLISIPAIDMPYHQMFHSLHLISSYVLAILVIFHVLGALYHYFWVKDKVLQSMLNSND
ncbi:cytochrome b [Gilliamella sp. ESL0443]|uniref:cytochrome b n=1 Tax=Gilliamella sp. ESL0443 TaxID=2704655 RepID=UPI001C6A7867|nr:cytochrome b/b6 domain-containing protein [Gilliamella sp. ESL0443]QYN42183.1 cytochrome b [Gilliamella sp. ESL0443]